MDNKKCKNLYPWVVVALLWVVALLNYMDRQMLSTMQESMKVDIVELRNAEVFGALMAVFLWIYGFASPFAGAVADKISRKWLIVGSLFVWSAVTFLMGSATALWQLYTLRAFMGISEALYIPSALSLIADWHKGSSRSLAIGLHMTGLYVGQAIGGFGATIAAHMSWQTTFHWFGITGVIYSVFLIFFLHENPDRLPADNTRVKSTGLKMRNLFSALPVLFSNWFFWIILFYFAAPSLPGWATKNWLPTLFADTLNIPMSEAGPISTITIAASSLIGVIAGGVMSDRWVSRNIRGRIYTSVAGLGLTIPSLLLLGYGDNLFEVVSAGILFGIGYGMFDTNNMPILCQFIPSRNRATAYGIMNMTGVFAGAAVTQLLGKWTDAGNLGEGFAMLSTIVAAAIILQVLFLNPKTDNME